MVITCVIFLVQRANSCLATCSSVSVPQRSSSGMKVAAPPSATPAARSTAAEMASVTGLPATPCAGPSHNEEAAAHTGEQVLAIGLITWHWQAGAHHAGLPERSKEICAHCNT